MFVKVTAAAVDICDLPIPEDRPIKANIDGHFFMPTAVIFSEDDVNPDGLLLVSRGH